MHATKKRFFYHGAPCSIDTFDFKFTGHGTDQHGAGFYFISDRNAASAFCDENEVTRRAGLSSSPTIHKVKLSIENPLDTSKIGGLTFAQAKAIISRVPNVEEKMWDFYDLGSMSLDAALNDAARMCSQFHDGELIRRINALSYTFYGNENIRELNHALKDVLGYDGVIHKEDKDVIMVAWFPDQIEIVQRIKYKDLSLEDEGPSL